jgi:DNA-binding LytR/AlgR family response regulator
MDTIRLLLLHSRAEVRTALRESLADAPGVRVLGEAVTAYEAMELLDHIPYGAIFLGSELEGGVSGFEMAQMLDGRKKKPGLVFIATDESLAYKAFELEAVDFILWPAPQERIQRCLERIRQFKPAFQKAGAPAGAEAGGEDDERLVKIPLAEDEEDRFLAALRQAWDFSRRSTPLEIEKLPITLDGRLILVPYDQIIFVEADEDYTYVHTANSKYLTSHRLKNLEDRLKQYRFFRVHRKYLVNLDMVTEIASLPGSNFMLRTAGRTRVELPVSRRRIAELKQILGL